MKERGNYWLRLLDRCAGIPLITALSLRKARPRPEKIRNILAVKIGTIGDTLLLMPVLKALKARKDSSLTVVCSRNNSAVLERYPFIDTLKKFEVSRAARDPFYFPSFIRDLNSANYDAALDFETWSRVSALITRLSNSSFTAGFETRGEHRHGAFDLKVPHSALSHESLNYRDLALAAGFSAGDERPAFPVFEPEKAFVQRLIMGLKIEPSRLILFHPWSSGFRGHLKEWRLERFVELAGLLIREGFIIGVTGAKENSQRSEEIVRSCPAGKAFSFSGRLTLGQTAALIERSRLLITVNTGIMHLGAALDSPMITLNGPAGALRWGPVWTGKAVNLQSGFDCAPCLNLGFEYRCKEGGCMDDIRPGDVFGKAIGILMAGVARDA